MTCLRENPKGADLLIGYLEQTLAPEERAGLDQHAAGCAECRELLAAQSLLEDEVPEVSADFDTRLYARFERDAGKSGWRRWLWRPAIPLAAVAAMVAVLLMVRTPAPEAPTDAPKQASVDRADIEQLEQVLDDLELLMPVDQTNEAL